MEDTMQTGELENNDNKQHELQNEEYIFDFEEQSWKTDFVIIVEGTRLHVARNILSLASPVFDRMLQSDFKESKNGELEMPTQKLEDVKLFLQCIYPNTLTQITCEIAKRILPLIEEYQVLQLKAACGKAITESVSYETPTDLLYQTLKDACLYDLKDVRKKCVRLASRKPNTETDASLRQYPLPHEVMNEILQLKIADLETLANELKSTKSELQKRITNLEEHETSMTSDLKTLNEYIAKDLKEVEELRLDPELKWKEAEILIKLDPNNDCRSCREIVVWDVKLSITADCRSRKGSAYGSIYYTAVEIENRRRQPMAANIEARFILIHGKLKTENIFCKIRGQLTARNNTIKQYIKETSYLTDQKNGFVKDKHIWLLVQVLMSEPIST
ncbi:uncharacterized protein LOC123542268 [Mercenaria mercenaria]|uniref:uncharacterized protein LOC123542268 n=1 Tax=Mercenaria mercenaria TaxID=6596 RepID=UPI001E1DE2EB|nr:uncharacterized protein LOC123542268 [Mercenaria mercenaria]